MAWVEEEQSLKADPKNATNDSAQALTPFADRIRTIYERATPHILPFIGQAFRSTEPDAFRAMAIGINAYSSDADWGRQPPELYAQWFAQKMYRYQKGVHRDLVALSAALVTPPSLFAGRKLAGMEAFFATNAIKVYMHQAEGKRATQISDAHFEAHLGQHHDELDAMAEANVLPHVIAIIGDPFWKFACAAFRAPERFRVVRVKEYRSVRGKCLHFVNRIVLDTPHGAHALVLVRLRHPASRRRTGSPQWLLEQPEFRALCAAPEARSAAGMT